MPTHYRDAVITCANCAATADRPAPGAAFRALYEEGWREKPNPEERPLRFAPHTSIWSCPACPAVAVY
jgi:hypothetical protein